MTAFKGKTSKGVLPFFGCGAVSQGYIGYHIQNAAQNEFIKNDLNVAKAITLASPTIANKDDKAFENPTKPSGNFMLESKAKSLALKNNWVVTEDARCGWRRVVASPKPTAIPSLPVVEMMIKENVATIAGKGRGIPTVKEQYLKGVGAAIYKDSIASFIATQIQANKLIILTAVDKVKIGFGTAYEKALDAVGVDELENYIKQNQFAPGSMLRKILAAVNLLN